MANKKRAPQHSRQRALLGVTANQRLQRNRKPQGGARKKEGDNRDP